MSSRPILFVLLSAGLVLFGCGGFPLSRFVIRTVEHDSDPVALVPHKLSNPILPDVGLSVLWVGHASVLIQIHDKVFLTDPSFSRTVGILSQRVVEPGIDPASLHHVDYVLVSHIHFDHLNYESLSDLPKQGTLLIPIGGQSTLLSLAFRKCGR